jgi:hypothetical protein
MAKVQFTATLESTAPRWPGGVMITLPEAASKKLGTRARVNVAGTINGYPFRNSMFPTGAGTHYLVINKQIREAIGVGAGDRVKMVLEVDTEPRTVAVPPDLRKAFSKSKSAKAAFDKLSPSHQREYIEHIEEAKRPETRARRIEQTLARLSESKPSE